MRADDLLWKPGYENWKPASAVPGLLTPPPPTSNNAFTTSSPNAEPEGRASKHTAKPSNTALAKGAPKLRFEALRRLWRGEQPLWKAFWLYFVLGSFVASGLAIVVFLSLAAQLEKMGFGDGGAYLGALAFPAAFFYDVFAAVGAWRSASWHTATGILARIYISLALLKIGALLAFAIKSVAS